MFQNFAGLICSKAWNRGVAWPIQPCHQRSARAAGSFVATTKYSNGSQPRLGPSLPHLVHGSVANLGRYTSENIHHVRESIARAWCHAAVAQQDHNDEAGHERAV